MPGMSGKGKNRKLPFVALRCPLRQNLILHWADKVGGWLIDARILPVCSLLLLEP